MRICVRIDQILCMCVHARACVFVGTCACAFACACVIFYVHYQGNLQGSTVRIFNGCFMCVCVRARACV